MKRFATVLLSILTATCQPAEGPAVAEGGAGLVAVDLASVSAALEGDEQAEVIFEIDGARSGEMDIAEETALVAFPARAGERALRVTVQGMGELPERSAVLRLRIGRDSIAPVRATLDEDGDLSLNADEPVDIDPDAMASVERADGEDVHPIALDPTAPALQLADLLARTDVRFVVPFTVHASALDQVGALVGPQRQPPRAELVASIVGTPAEGLDSALEADLHARILQPEAKTASSDELRLHPAVLGEAGVRDVLAPEDLELEQPEDAWMFYWAFCRCAKPSPNSRFALTTPDGRALVGHTDMFGMVMVPGLEKASIRFGGHTGKRERTYAYEPQNAAVQRSMLAGLTSDDANERLVSMLDLRREPLAEARDHLEEMIYSVDIVDWFNAAVTLSHYEGIEDIVAGILDRLELVYGIEHESTLRMISVLGALRHPDAATFLTRALQDDRHYYRSRAAWALGFTGDPSAVDALASALADSHDVVRAEVALALGRVAADAAPLTDEAAAARSVALARIHGLLSDAAADPSARVQVRAADALALLSL